MRYEYIDPFVTTTIRVLDSAIPGSIRRGDVTVLQGDRMKGDVAVLVRITGDAEGDIILSMDTATALRICASLFREDFAVMTPRSVDALMEIANMITGNAVSALNDQGFDFAVSPPWCLREMTAGNGSPTWSLCRSPFFLNAAKW